MAYVELGLITNIHNLDCCKPTKQKNTPFKRIKRVFWNRELTMTYSHMGEPHYHWRIGVSLLSSGRDQVGPPSYYRQQRGIEK